MQSLSGDTVVRYELTPDGDTTNHRKGASLPDAPSGPGGGPRLTFGSHSSLLLSELREFSRAFDTAGEFPSATD
jgi:hypothetical protein